MENLLQFVKLLKSDERKNLNLLSRDFFVSSGSPNERRHTIFKRNVDKITTLKWTKKEVTSNSVYSDLMINIYYGNKQFFGN